MIRVLLAVLALALAGSCGPSHRAPPGRLPPIRQAGADAYGAWVSVDWHDGGPRRTAGELIALGPAFLYVLPDSALVNVPLESTDRIQVSAYVGHALWFAPGDQGLARGLAPADADRLRRFARFPAGIPAGVDPASLRAGPRRALPPPGEP